MEDKIINLFAFNNKLKFNEIERLLNTRSNKLAYHLRNLINKNILIKENNNYSLTENSEYLIPYLSEKNHALPIILINLGNRESVFLYKRNKRPYKDCLSLPGGRILIGESVESAVSRIMREKFNINAKYEKINSISLEHVKKNNKIIHSFFLIFVSAKTKDKIKLINVKRNKPKIIKSDYYLIKNKTNSKISLDVINSNII